MCKGSTVLNWYNLVLPPIEVLARLLSRSRVSFTLSGFPSEHETVCPCDGKTLREIGPEGLFEIFLSLSRSDHAIRVDLKESAGEDPERDRELQIESRNGRGRITPKRQNQYSIPFADISVSPFASVTVQ